MIMFLSISGCLFDDIRTHLLLLESQAHGKGSRPRIGQTHDPTKMWLHQMYNAGDGVKNCATRVALALPTLFRCKPKGYDLGRFWDDGRKSVRTGVQGDGP
jgi:hypothetical protein